MLNASRLLTQINQWVCALKKGMDYRFSVIRLAPTTALRHFVITDNWIISPVHRQFPYSRCPKGRVVQQRSDTQDGADPHPSSSMMLFESGDEAADR